MSERIHVKPAADPRKLYDHGHRLVADPKHRDHLPAEGRMVPRSSYWLRRLRAGDVELVEAKAAKAAAAPVEQKPEPRQAKRSTRQRSED